MKRRWLKLVLIIVVVLALAVLGTLILLQTSPVNRLILNRARDYLLHNSGVDFNASQMRLDPLGRAITLDNVTVSSKSALNLPPLLKASKIYVRLGVLNIARGLIDLEELQLTNPQIHYFVGQDGKTNIPELPASSGPSPNFLIARAKVRQGSFEFEDLRSRLTVMLPLWQMSVNGDRLTLNHQFDFTTEKAAVIHHQDRTVPIDYVKAKGTLKKKSVQLDSAELGALDSNLSMRGSLKDFSRPVFDLQLDPRLNLGRIAPVLGINEQIAGSLSGRIHANGQASQLNISAQLLGHEVTAAEYRRTSFDVQGIAEWGGSRLLLRSFTMNSPEGSVSGTADFFTGTGAGTGRIEASLRDFDLYPIWKQIKAPFDLASRATGKISFNWKGPLQVSAMDALAHLNLTATRLSPAKDLLPVAGGVDAQIRSGNVLGTLKTFSVMGAQLNGTFSLHSFQTVDSSVRGSIPNVESTLAQVSEFVGSRDHTLVGIRVAGPIQFNAQATGKLSSPKIVVSADSPDLQAANLKQLRVKTDATIQDSQVAFQNTVELPHDSLVSTQGTLEFRPGKTILNLDAHTERMPAPTAISLLGGSFPAEGILNADLHLEGPIDDLTGKGSVSGDQFSVYQEPLGHFEMGLHIAGGEILSDQFRFARDPQRPDTNYIDASFGYGMSSGQFQFRATGKDLIWERQNLPGGKRLEGTVNLIASGRGTLEQPAIDVKIDSQNLGIDKSALGPVSVTASLRGDQATIEANAPRLNVSSTVHLSDRSPYPFQGELQISGADLSLLGLQAANKQPLMGTIAATLNGSGDLEKPAEAQFSAQIQTLDVRAGKFSAHTEAPVRAEYRAQSIELLTPATIVSGNSKLEIAGRIPLRQAASSGSLTLKGQIDLAQAAGVAPVPEGFSAAGTMNLDLSLIGTPRELTAAGTITMDNGSVQIPRLPAPFTNITIRASVQDGSLILQRADAAMGEANIAIQGELPFALLPQNIPVRFPRKQGPARFTLDLTNFKPEMTGFLPQGITGLVSVHATGETAGPNLRSLSAQIVFGELSFKANEIALAQNGNSTILVRDGIASISKFSLSGTDTVIEATGSAGLLPDGPLNLKLTGNLDAALLTFMNRDLKTAGKLRVQLAVGGNRRAPRLSGLAEMSGGRVTLRSPRVVADSLNARMDLAPNLITIKEFRSTLNGGSLTMDGTIGYQRGTLNNFNLRATLQDVFLDFPEGLKSISNGNLTITSADESIVVGGTMRILESSYREPFDLAGPVMSYLRSQHVVVGGMEPSPILARIRFNLAMRTSTPLLVQNNIAKLEAAANLRLVGTFYEPSLVGRVTLEQGGEIVLNQRTYYIERGTVTLNDQSQIRPELDIEAQTKVDVYDITMQLTGPPERFSTALTSEPSLPEPDIISLLLTGKTSSESTQQVARTQALSLIAGQAGEEVAREARQALHLSTFRFDPGGLIASESDLGARLTIGEDITRDFSLAYSMNLVDSGKQIWAGQYKVTRALTTQATKQEDNSYRFEFRHDLRFGGTPPARTSRSTAQKFTIGSIQFEGANVPDKVLLEKLKIKPGDKYDFPKVQKGLDRLHTFYTGQKRLEADIRLHRETQQKIVDLNLNVNPGPVVEFSYEGMSLPSKVKENVEKTWGNGVFDTERIEDALAAIRRPLIQEGYLQPQISYKTETNNDRKTVSFHIDPGTHYSNVPVVFSGASQIGAGALSNTLERANLGVDVYADSQKVVDYLKQYYTEHGYLQASVGLPQPRLDPKTGTGEVSIQVQEGPQFTIGDLEFGGNSAFTYDQLWSVIPTSTGSFYSPKSLQDSAKAIENLYHTKGYNEVSIAYRIVQDPKTAHANVTFQVTERRQSFIRDIVIQGNEDTSRNFVQRQLGFKLGDVLDFSKIDETRKRLYSTGVYTSVDFQNEEIPGQKPDSREKDVRVRIRLREVRPYRLQYGLFYDTDRGPGGLLEVQNLDLLGRASALGMKLRYDTDLKEARLYYNQPFVTNNFLKLDATAFVQQEDRAAFSARRVGFSLFREKALPRKYVFDYGYRYDHVRWNGLPPDPTLFQASVPVARLIATVTRDTRDSILDATRGELTSHSFEFGPRWLGSETGFTRYFGQYFRYVPLDKYLGKPTKDSEGNRIPASLVYAGALRLGLTATFGGQPVIPPELSGPFGGNTVISPERFFAGGGTTMRGFEQDLLGPTHTVIVNGKPTPRPLGGEALFLFNNEIRFPIVGILQGVGFIDIGNVYPQISDFNFSLRKSAGAGLRIKVKFVPLRLDYGFKLDRKPGESRGAFFFSIGQAF